VPFSPTLGPPRNIAVNGLSARFGLAGTGVTPTVSWQPPSIGTATHYTVDVRKLTRSVTSDGSIRTNTGGGSRVAFLETAGTSIALPPGILTADANTFYYLIVSSRQQPERDTTFSNPNRGVFVDYQSPAITGVFHP
jgi:hypothetical protein